MMSTSVPETAFFMPTALSIQNTFEGAGRKMSPSCADNIPSMMSTSVPETTFFMPTALSIQNTFEGAGRKRSPSLQESELKQ
jgi:zinc transporter ZupT